MSAVLALANPHRIKASHRRRRRVASGRFVQRYYDPMLGRFLSPDPDPSDMNTGWNFNRYNYAANNPYKYTDPDGRIIETPWDVANVALGVVSIGANITAGNYVSAAVDLGGLIYDGAATVVPGLPAGAGVALKVYRAGDKAVDVYKGSKLASNMADVGKPVLKGVEEAHHVVAKNATAAGPARDILKKHGIGVDSSLNGAALKKASHQTTHTKKYYNEVNERLTKADAVGGKSAVCKELRNIAKELKKK